MDGAELVSELLLCTVASLFLRDVDSALVVPLLLAQWQNNIHHVYMHNIF